MIKVYVSKLLTSVQPVGSKDEVLLTALQLSVSWRGVQGRKRRAE